jgi:hypothetical protein
VLSAVIFRTKQTSRQAMQLQLNIETRSCSHRCSSKAISIKYSECMFVALVKQHAKRMHHIMLSSVDSMALPHSSIFSNKSRIKKLNTKKLLNIKCVFDFSTTQSEKFPIIRKKSARFYRKCT